MVFAPFGNCRATHFRTMISHDKLRAVVKSRRRQLRSRPEVIGDLLIAEQPKSTGTLCGLTDPYNVRSQPSRLRSDVSDQRVNRCFPLSAFCVG